MLKKIPRTALALALASALLLGTSGTTTLQGKTTEGDGARPSNAHNHGHEPAGSDKKKKKGRRELARKVARARVATAEFATDLDAAKSDGYRIITPMIPDMGFHFLNPNIAEFDIKKPPILVYVKRNDHWQLVAFEWVFTEKPDKKPLPGARYGSFGAACHYDDGTFYFESSQDECDTTSPDSGAPFFFWHPDLVTLHLWAWYPNPEGIFNGTNPLVRPFNRG
jgi:hypothetical protein